MKRYELNFHAGTLSLFVNGNPKPAHVYDFASGEACRRNVIRLWLKVVERSRLRMVAPVGNAWVYEGFTS